MNKGKLDKLEKCFRKLTEIEFRWHKNVQILSRREIQKYKELNKKIDE